MEIFGGRNWRSSLNYLSYGKLFDVWSIRSILCMRGGRAICQPCLVKRIAFLVCSHTTSLSVLVFFVLNKRSSPIKLVPSGLSKVVPSDELGNRVVLFKRVFFERCHTMQHQTRWLFFSMLFTDRIPSAKRGRSVSHNQVTKAEQTDPLNC